MSTWSCEDFDATTNQSVFINQVATFDMIKFKIIKFGTVASAAVFTVTLLDGSRTIFSNTFTGAELNALDSNVRIDVAIECTNTRLTPSLDGSEHEYTLRFSGSGYTSSAASQVLLVRREFGDNVLTIPNLPSGFPDIETASAYPIFVEFFSFQ